MAATNRLSAEVLGYFQELKNDKTQLSILAIGEPGSGKTTLVNNLLGEKVAGEQDEDSASALSTFHGVVQGVNITVYEYSGIDRESDQHQEMIEELLSSGSISVTLYCFKMADTRLRRSLIDSFKMYTRIGGDWNKTVIALTFADSVLVPKSVRQDPNYDAAKHFSMRVEEWNEHIRSALILEVKLSKKTAHSIAMFPTSDSDERLPNNEEWIQPVWVDILQTIRAIPQPSRSRRTKIVVVGGMVLFVAILVGVAGCTFVCPFVKLLDSSVDGYCILIGGYCNSIVSYCNSIDGNGMLEETLP